MSESGAYCTVKVQERTYIMNNSNLDFSDIVYHDKSKDRHYVKCGGGGKYKCKKSKYVTSKYSKNIKTEDEVMRFLTSEGWVKIEEKLKSRMWRCPECSSQQPNEISDTTLKARRQVLMQLDGYYDECKKAYKKGQSDQSIAKSCDMSEQAVKTIRLDFFGELVEPNPLEICNNKLDVLEKEFIAFGHKINNLRNKIEENSIR